MKAFGRALRVAKGEEGGMRCGLGQLALVTFGGGGALLVLLAALLAMGPGR